MVKDILLIKNNLDSLVIILKNPIFYKNKEIYLKTELEQL